ncbi:MAG TPA: L,D-transpeptidase family protein [Candidatus Paceibacterota bacterium]|nr:L,D-transpeptidase family protein [Candidatus Paceibacterota bacterium]
MSHTEYSFDWKACYFSAKVFFIVAAVGFGIQVGLPYVQLSPYTPTQGAQVVATQTASAIPVAEAATLSTTTPERVLAAITIPETIPPTGKFIAADLVHMVLYLYQDGTTTAEYPILTKGKPGTPWETPSGYYSILSKQKDFVNGWEQVKMPYSMQFYGNYFIHGWPTYEDGTPVDSSYSGGCIRLSTEDAAKVFAFADIGTGVFVYDTGAATSAPPLIVTTSPLPVSADAYLVADLDTGDVYAEHNAEEQLPIASVTKLMTALVANEVIMFDRSVTVPRGELHDIDVATDTTPETFKVGDLLYPLLMESNNSIADTLAAYWGKGAFVSWMNSQAKALDMASTTFVDPSGVSAQNVSTPDDLYRLAVYLANKKSFVWKITSTPEKAITADDGSSYTFNNFNEFSASSTFIGGKVGHTDAANDTMVSVFSVPIDGEVRRIAVIVLNSQNYTTDTQALVDWFTQSASPAINAACASCAAPQYQKIPL